MRSFVRVVFHRYKYEVRVRRLREPGLRKGGRNVLVNMLERFHGMQNVLVSLSGDHLVPTPPIRCLRAHPGKSLCVPGMRVRRKAREGGITLV